MDNSAQIPAHLEQIDHRLDGIDRRLDGHDRRFDEHDRRFDEHDRRFDEHDRQFALVRQEIKDEAALLRQELKDEAALLRQEIKDSARGLHVRFERLEDTMRLVAERVSEFNQESRSLRSRVTHLETSQVNTDLRLIALERKKRKS